jgi:hypothetical protein
LPTAVDAPAYTTGHELPPNSRSWVPDNSSSDVLKWFMHRNRKKYGPRGCPIYFVLRQTGHGYIAHFHSYADDAYIETYPENPMTNRRSCIKVCTTFAFLRAHPDVW